MEGLWLLPQEQNILYFQLSVKMNCQWDHRDKALTKFRSRIHHCKALRLFCLLQKRLSFFGLSNNLCVSGPMTTRGPMTAML